MTAVKRYAIGKLWRIACRLTNEYHANCMSSMSAKIRRNPALRAAYKRKAAMRKAQKVAAKAARVEADALLTLVILGEHRVATANFTQWRLHPMKNDSQLRATTR